MDGCVLQISQTHAFIYSMDMDMHFCSQNPTASSKKKFLCYLANSWKLKWLCQQFMLFNLGQHQKGRLILDICVPLQWLRTIAVLYNHHWYFVLCDWQKGLIIKLHVGRTWQRKSIRWPYANSLALQRSAISSLRNVGIYLTVSYNVI
jgi:hypothetical protein